MKLDLNGMSLFVRDEVIKLSVRVIGGVVVIMLEIEQPAPIKDKFNNQRFVNSIKTQSLDNF